MTNKRSIPEIRERLLEIAEENNLPEIKELVDEMYRRPPNRRAPPRSQKLTPPLAAEIRRYAKAHPTEAMDSIGHKFKVNPGRISEAIDRKT